MTVFLTGFMGTGKTTVGRRLAERLGLVFVDTDEEIERLEGHPISEIFANDGEAYFRKVEQSVIDAAPADAVVATGGGAMIDPRNCRRMRAAGPIICLTADPETIYERTAANRDRPLLAEGDARHRIRELLARRAAAYAQADYTIDTERLDVEAVVEAIVEYLKQRREVEETVR